MIYQKTPQLFHRLTKDEIPAIANLPKVVAAENEHYVNVGVGPFRSAFNTGMVSKKTSRTISSPGRISPIHSGRENW